MDAVEKVVARFLTGESLEGDLVLFDPFAQKLTLRTGSEEREVDCTVLKAIFFLRRPNTAPYPDSFLKPAGKKVCVVFADGEAITGYSYGLRPREEGFYLFPVNQQDRNERIYVIRKNAIRIQTESK